jgi:hypothetical protein
MDMSIGANFNGRERRRHLRLRLEVSGRLEARPQTPIACEIYNISVGGALLESRLRLRLGQGVVLHLDDFGAIEAHVARVTSTTVGLPFEGVDRTALAAFITARSRSPEGEIPPKDVAEA